MSRKPVAALTLLVLVAITQSACAPSARPSAAPPSTGLVHVAPPTGEREADRASILAALERVRPGGTVQFARGRYLVGRMIRIDTPGITLLGHSEGTVLRGCELDEYEAMELDFIAAFERDGFDVDPGILGRCGQFHLTGGNVTVRSLTFEQSRLGLVLGCCEDERVLRSFAGGYRIEENHFRNTGNSIRAWVQAEEPTVIRGNEFTNTFHALSASGSRIHFVDNRLTVPDPTRVPFETHPGFGVAIGAYLGALDGDARPPIEACVENVIAGNHIEGHPDAVLLIASPGTTCRDNVIRNNTLLATRVPRPAVWRFEGIWPINDPDDPTFVGLPLWLWGDEGSALPPEFIEEGLAPGRVEGTRVEGNRILGAEGLGMQLINASRNRIVGNTISQIRVRDPFPGNAPGAPAGWKAANGSGIWISAGSEENEIRGNTLEDIAAYAVFLEGDRNRVELRSARDAVRDLGRDNRVTAPGYATQHITDLEAELEAIVEEFRGDNDRFGVLFASFDGDSAGIHVAGDIRPDDHLRLGSVSKVFLGFMVLREGLSPDATIETFYPSEPYPHADAITARMLLSHTSGIPDEMGRRMREFGPGADPAEVLRALQSILAAPAPHPDERIAAIYNHDLGLDFAPGTRWCYSNPGYVMLGRLLERSTGQPMERLLARHFGEVAPSLYLDDGRDANFPDSYPHPWPIHWSQPWVAGALIATAADAAVAFHHISQQPEFQMMQEWMTLPRCPADIVFGDDYGLGLQRYVFDGIGDAIGHDGHIIARSLLFQLGGTSYLIHTTRSVDNADLRAIAQRLLATQR